MYETYLKRNNQSKNFSYPNMRIKISYVLTSTILKSFLFLCRRYHLTEDNDKHWILP